jgi:hypothetical protein
MSGSTVAGAAAVVAALLLAGCADDASAPRRAAAGDAAATAARAAGPDQRRAGADRGRESCATRSGASFDGVYTNPDNVVVGPLVMLGGVHTPADVVREFGGDKIFVLLRPGHRVTLELPRRVRSVAGLGYGRLPQGVELGPRDGHRSVTFVACGLGEETGSTADGRPVTFWSGFVLASAPVCVPLSVWVDGARTPRHVTLAMGVPTSSCRSRSPT